MAGVLRGLIGSFAPVATAFDSIATATGTGSSGTITFSSIPSTYQHLQLRIISRVDIAGSSIYGNLVTFNSDTGNNYTHHRLAGSGTAASAAGFATGSYAGVLINGSPGDSLLAATYSVDILDIHDYANTSKYKTVRSIGGYEFNNTIAGNINLRSSLWVNTSAISSITITNLNAGNYIAGSTFALYGIKGA